VLDTYGLGGLDINNNGIFDEKICKVFTNDRIVINNTDRMLGDCHQSKLLQFNDQSIFVDLFQEAVAKVLYT